MPAVVDWRRDALVYVKMIHKDNKDPNQDYKELVKKFFNERSEIPNILDGISNLESPHEDLLDGQVVKFRAMIQDMFGVEYYLDTCRVQTENGTIEERPTIFRDVPCLGPNETLVEEDMDAADRQLSSREKMYAVTIPGITDWAQSIVVGDSPNSSNKHATLPEKFSKPFDSSCEGRCAFKDKPAGNPRKRSHYPLDQDYTGCVLKLYENADLQIDKAYELIAVLSNDPSIESIENPPSPSNSVGSPRTDESDSSRPQSQNNSPSAHVPRQENDADNSTTEPQNSPTASPVHRLHLLKCTKLKQLNPLLTNTEEVTLGKQEARDLRESVVNILTSMLFGDALAAEYLLILLISAVNHRHGEAIGQFPLNISGVTDKMEKEGFVAKLNVLLSHLLSVVVLQDVTLSTLNDRRMNSCKLEDDDRVTSGILQLADSSLLVLNETTLTEGECKGRAFQNMEAVKKLCQKQTYKIEFPYAPTEVQKDIKVLLVSEGASFFRDCSTRVQMKPVHIDVEAAVRKVKSLLEDDQDKIWKIRKYLTEASLFKSGLDSSMEQFIQNEFVRNRQEGGGMTPEGLHHLLTLSRLIGQSCGEPTLTKDIWNAAIALEQERKLRLNNL